MILDEVNEQRLGKFYADEEAAIEFWAVQENCHLQEQDAFPSFLRVRREPRRLLDIQQHGHPV